MPDPYISEAKYLGGPPQDFVEIAVDAGTDVSNIVVTIYNSDGTVRSTNSLSGLTYNTIAGRDVYVIESGSPASFSGLHKFGGIALSEGGTVYQFISFSDDADTITATEGPADGLTSTDVGMAGSGQSLESTDYGATYGLLTTPSKGTIPCLTRGTRVQTDKGQVKVEDLVPGMRLLTVEGDFTPVRLVLNRRVTHQEICENEKLAPVRITASALTMGRPSVDLLVSRQHRMLVSSRIAERMFNKTSVLVSAIRLTALPGIFVDPDVRDVEYFHIVLDQHSVIFAENAPTESLFVGEHMMASLPDQTVEELTHLFPRLAWEYHSLKSARFIPSPRRQRKLVERHAKNAHDLLSMFHMPSRRKPEAGGGIRLH